MSNFRRWRKGIGIDSKPVILTGDLDAAGRQVLHGLVGSAMPALELVGPGAKRVGEQLVAQTNPEQRDTCVQGSADRGNRVLRRRSRVTRTVREENPVRLVAQDVFGAGIGRDHGY